MIGQARACASLPVVVTQSNTRPPNPRPSGPRPPNVRQRSPAGTLQHPQAFADLFGWFGWSPGAVSETTAPPHKVHANGKAPAGAPCHTLVVGSGSSKALQEASESQPGGPQPEPRLVTCCVVTAIVEGREWRLLHRRLCYTPGPPGQ